MEKFTTEEVRDYVLDAVLTFSTGSLEEVREKFDAWLESVKTEGYREGVKDAEYDAQMSLNMQAN